MSRYHGRPGGDAEPEPCSKDRSRSAGWPARRTARRTRPRPRAVPSSSADLGQDPHDFPLRRRKSNGRSLGTGPAASLSQFLPSHSSCAPRPGAQGVEPPSARSGVGSIGAINVQVRGLCLHRPGQRLLDLLSPRWCHAAGEALQLEGVGALLVGEVAVPALVAAAAINPVGLHAAGTAGPTPCPRTCRARGCSKSTSGTTPRCQTTRSARAGHPPRSLRLALHAAAQVKVTPHAGEDAYWLDQQGPKPHRRASGRHAKAMMFISCEFLKRSAMLPMLDQSPEGAA